MMMMVMMIVGTMWLLYVLLWVAVRVMESTK